MSARVVAAIFARGGSKGIPRKNLRALAGKPLIVHAIDAARRTSGVLRVVVSTDDQEIAAVARAAGADVPFIRPTALATDDSPEWLSWQHLVRELGGAGAPYDTFLSVPTTSPLREPCDLEACLARLDETGVDIAITVRHAERNPYFNMVTLAANGRAELVIKPAAPAAGRQSAPLVYAMTTVAYAARWPYVLEAKGVFDGCVTATIIPAERAIDIDTELDFSVAEFLMTRRVERMGG